MKFENDDYQIRHKFMRISFKRAAEIMNISYNESYGGDIREAVKVRIAIIINHFTEHWLPPDVM